MPPRARLRRTLLAVLFPAMLVVSAEALAEAPKSSSVFCPRNHVSEEAKSTSQTASSQAFPLD